MSGHEVTPENLKKSKGETVSYQNPERDAELVIEKGANFLEIIRVSPRRTRFLRLGSGQAFCFGKRTQNHAGCGVALRGPCAVRRLRRWRKLAEPVLRLTEGLRQCAPVFPDSAALLGHAKGQIKSWNIPNAPMLIIDEGDEGVCG